MRIKHLSIRNIASVETADIDFEHGPVDHATGAPASLFLITGDTGSGKSVILDCISMALYGTTPRVKGVNGVSNNRYKYNADNDVAINDITQYTRLGISHKDPCYARLIFEGNDGVDYISTFSLGYTNRHTYASEKWVLQVGKDEIMDRKKEVAARIVDAVGLTFEQFGRMAMLAQGQFANFLTGKKEERERILEQLTATDRFSRYGEAIANIFKRAKDAKMLAESQCNTYNKLLLSDQDLAALRAELDALNSRASATEAAARAEEALAKATVEREKALSDLSTFRRIFDAMASDLAAREGRLASRRTAIEEDKKWFDTLGPQRKIFENASVIIEHIKRYTKLCEDIAKKQATIPAAEAAQSRFASEVAATDKAVGQVVKAVEEVKAQIDSLTAERRKMDPEGLLKAHTSASNRLKALSDLAEALTTAATHRAETAECSAATDALGAKVKTLAAQADKAKEDESAREREARAAEDLYTTMHLSVQENFTALRARMAQEHASHCPLCRQAITDHAALCADDDFARILSPLEQEKNRLAALLKAAKDSRIQAVSDLSSARGSLRSKVDELTRLRKRDEAESAKITRAFELLGIENQDKPEAEISTRITATRADIDAVKAQMDAAQAIQKQIDEALKLHSDREAARKTADKAFTAASTGFNTAKMQLEALLASITELNSERSRLRADLSDTLSDYAPAWSDNPAQTMETLRIHADDFNSRLDKVRNDESALRVDSATLEALSRTAAALRPILSDITPAPPSPESDDVAHLPLEFIRNKWMELHSMASARRSAMEKAITDIKDNTQVINDFYVANQADDEFRAVPIAERNKDLNERRGAITLRLSADAEHRQSAEELRRRFDLQSAEFDRWNRLNAVLGGTRFRTLVQSHILRPLLRNANVYLEQITDHYTLTCSDDNEQLSILVLDRYNRNATRSVTVLSGGERFMISLALSLALSAMSRPDMNVDILFIDEGFGTLDAKSLDQVMSTLRRLPQIAGQTGRRVGVISHREELAEQIDARIVLRRCGEGRSRVLVE